MQAVKVYLIVWEKFLKVGPVVVVHLFLVKMECRVAVDLAKTGDKQDDQKEEHKEAESVTKEKGQSEEELGAQEDRLEKFPHKIIAKLGAYGVSP